MPNSVVVATVHAAVQAMESTSLASPQCRSLWLRGLADALDTHRDVLVSIAESETALGEARLEGEVARTTSQLRMFALLLEAGAPAEVFGWVEGSEAGQELVQHPGIKAVGFTGSVAGGRALLDLINQRPDPVPFHGELGSINPVLVTPGAAKRRPVDIAEELVDSSTLGSGQFCTKPGLVMVPHDCLIRDHVQGLVPDGPVRMLSERIANGYRQGADRLIADGRPQPIGPSSFESEGSPRPIVLTGRLDDFARPGDLSPIDEECFEPVTVVLTYQDRSEVLDLLDRLPASLTFSIHGESEDHAWLEPVIPRVRAMAGASCAMGGPSAWR